MNEQVNLSRQITHIELLDYLRSGLVQPLILADFRLLLQVRGVWCACLPLHFRVLRQLQLLKALELRDPFIQVGTHNGGHAVSADA